MAIEMQEITVTYKLTKTRTFKVMDESQVIKIFDELKEFGAVDDYEIISMVSNEL